MYFIEVFSVFLFFLFIGAFFSPFIGGCIGVIIVFSLLVGFIIFFSLNFIWFLAVGLVFYAVGFIIKYIRYHNLPDINQYISKYPNVKLADGVVCYNCGSTDFANRGLLNSKSKLRYYSCNQCGTVLFRFRVL